MRRVFTEKRKEVQCERIICIREATAPWTFYRGTERLERTGTVG